MRRTPLMGAVVAVAAVIAAAAVATARADVTVRVDLANVSPLLAKTLATVSGKTKVPVMVHGETTDDATRAAREAGMTVVTTFRKVGVVVAAGTADQITATRAKAGITYLEGDQRLSLSMETSHLATRGRQARGLRDGAGRAVDGRGVGVAVIDTGVDGTHPAVLNADGTSAVKKNLKFICTVLQPGRGGLNDLCFLDLTGGDTDTLSVGGHGTHVAGIVAGRDVTLTDGGKVHGAAPGAAVYGLSVGVAVSILGADAALNWVLDHHRAPCGAGVPASTCPPIKVTNNSYGPSGGGAFDPNSATVKIQRALAREGVMTVWANGNDGGDGSASLSNPAGMDPTPGVVSVASYNDNGTGTRAGTVSEFSSRGKAGSPGTYPDISAPGDAITSACRLQLVVCTTGLQPRNGPGLLDIGTFNTISGTSMAAPHIAGIIAQLFQVAPSATPARVEDALKATAYKFRSGAAYQQVGAYTTSFDKGTGLVDAGAAARRLGAR